MNADFTPATPGSRHPLDHIADAPARHALARLLASQYDSVLSDGRVKLARHEDFPGHPCPRELLPAVITGVVEFLHAGTLDGMETAFRRAVEQADASLTPFEAAARVRQALGAMTLAAFPTVLDAWDGTESRDDAMALLIAASNIGSARLHSALTRTVLQEMAAERERQLEFYREIVRLATNGGLRLVEPQELPAPQGPAHAVLSAKDASRLRREARAVAEGTGMAAERAEDFGLAVGEAVANVLKHAGGGVVHLWRDADSAFAFVADKGKGITMDVLPKALSPGWSSQTSLGMGFTLIMEMADVLWLSTGSDGTLLCIEQRVNAPTEPLMGELLLDDIPLPG